MTIRPHGDGEVTVEMNPSVIDKRTDKIHRNPSISTCRVSCTPRATAPFGR
jgi:hypothetical protein